MAIIRNEVPSNDATIWIPGKFQAGRSGLVKLIRPVYWIFGSVGLMMLPLMGTVLIAKAPEHTKVSSAVNNFLLMFYALFLLFSEDTSPTTATAEVNLQLTTA